MRPESRDDFSVAVICALPLEADAVEARFDETYDRLGKYYGKQRGDANAYVNGRIGNHHVVLCYMPGMGKGSAASVASSLQVSYTNIELALVVGICGGVPTGPNGQEIYLGDVIISDSVIQYDFGRQYPGGFQRKSGVKDTLGRPNQTIRSLLNGLRAENARYELETQIQQYLEPLQRTGTRWCHPQTNDILFHDSYLHKHYRHDASIRCGCEVPGEICDGALDSSCDELKCEQSEVIRRREFQDLTRVSTYIGTIASADTVMKSGQHRDTIAQKEKVIGFDMEGAGVWDNISCIVIKGVCDYADSHKSDTWQAYAAATGASAAKAFLEYWPPRQKQGTIETRHFVVPFERNHRFVGRRDEIDELEEKISTPNGPRKLAIFGLGGVGKTQVALELAYRIYDREAETSVFWITCTSYEAINQAYMTIAQTLGIQNVKPAKVKDCIKSYFDKKDRRWLLIYDNADDIDLWIKGSNTAQPLKDFLPWNNQGRILFTTRNRQLAARLAISDLVHIRELDEKSGMEFLESLVQEGLLGDSRAATDLLEQLTFLPLAVAQASAFINENGIAVSDYLLLLQEQETDVIELLSKDFGDDSRYKDVQNPVAKTWLISFSQIQASNQLAADYLSLMACVNPRNIPRSFLPEPSTKIRLVEALGLLNAYSFITVQPRNGPITLHRLVHLATRNWIKNEGRFALYIRKAADRLNENFPDHEHQNRPLWRQYLPHALSLLGEREFEAQRNQYLQFIWNVGSCLDSDGRYNEAEPLLLEVMKGMQRMPGPEHPNTLISMSHLALTYQNQGQWEKAEELYMQLVKLSNRVLGPEDPDTLISMGNLATTYCNQGRWKEAEELGVNVLETMKKVLGYEHPDTLSGLANLAANYLEQGRWKEAEELLMQVTSIEERVLGPKHPDTLTSMANLAGAYGEQGKFKEAEQLDVQVLAIRKQELGPEHPDTLSSMANLAVWYSKQRRWKEAKELQVQVLKVSEQVLGPKHPDTLRRKEDLSETQEIQALWKEHENLQAKMSNIRSQMMAELTDASDFASIFRTQGRLKEAEWLELHIMEASKKALGAQDPFTLTSMADLAYTWKSLGNTHAAIALMKACAEIRNRVLGPGHSDSIASSNSIRAWEAELSCSSQEPAQQNIPGRRTQPSSLTMPGPDRKPDEGSRRRAFMKLFRRK